MQRSRLLLLFLTSFVYSVRAAPLVVNTPDQIVQCEVTDISWSGGTGTYSLVRIRDNGQVVEDAARLSQTTFQWAGYGAPAGSNVIIYVTDSAGHGASSAPLIVQPSSDSSCLPPDGSAV